MAQDQSHPWAGYPRVFRAAAVPNGDARFGVEGPLVFLCEQRGGCVDRAKYLSRAEAEQLHRELDAALRVFAVGPALAGADRPTAYRGPYPIRDHGTLADLGFLDDEVAASGSAAVGRRSVA
jgi:hypothetical protein